MSIQNNIYEIKDRTLVCILPWEYTEVIEVSKTIQYFILKYNFDSANKIIKSAAIDVTSVEPIEKDSKLFELENLLITPHIAWKSEKSLIRLMDNVENNLKMFLEGKLEGLK